MEDLPRVLIADDHTLVRAGLRALLDQLPGINVVGEVDNGFAAIRAAGELAADLVLMDLTMPEMNGMEAIKEIKRRYPKVRVLVVTLHKTEEYIDASLKAGADGYIQKVATPDEFRIAIDSVLSGKGYLSPEVSANVASRTRSGGKSANVTSIYDSLTHREREVLKLVSEGKSNKAIARLLFISVKTVEKHRSNLMAKLDMHNVSELTTYAMEKGLIVR